MRSDVVLSSDDILELLSTAVIVLGRDRRVCYLNAAAEGLLQISARQAISMELSRLLASSDTLEWAIERALERQASYMEREHRLVVGSARAVTVNCAVTPLAQGRILLELDELDCHLRIFRENQLIAQNRAVRELIRNLAHEIKNPLGGLRGAAQLLQQELLEPGQHEYTKVIISEADRLRALVDGLLGPDSRAHFQATNIHQLLEHVRHLVQVEAPAGVAIVRDYDPSIPLIQAAPDRIIQVLLNLVRNALQAVGDRGVITLHTRTQRRFTIGAVEHRLVACIKIIDDGRGIPAERQDTIFYPMASDCAQGSGLGLPIAQTLVFQHGGLIECASEPGHTVFTVWLPIEKHHE
ncbi:MAG: ATP-binding protein [Nitrococcus sp.]|nr:ATP-binding protein [Nitrococcus sp.]